MWVPTRMIDLQSVMAQLRVRYVRPAEGNYEGEFEDEQTLDPSNDEVCCYDLSRSGFIGVPRDFGIRNLRIPSFLDNTVKPVTYGFVAPNAVIRARDDQQRAFFETLAGLIRAPKPVDIVANARTGTGKTVTALYTFAEVIKSPTLVAVPTTYLLDQWRKRIVSFFGKEWANKYMGHVQRDTMDYKGRMIVLAVMKSLAIRDYPMELRRYFSALIIDEFHKVGTPSMHSILAKYPASIRIGFTATNRRDAMYKVSSFHLGRPRAISTQEVMRPHVYRVKFDFTLPRSIDVASEYAMINILSRLHARNELLLRIIYDRGVQRGRRIVALSDRVDQLQSLMRQLVAMGVDEDKVGLLVGEYREGKKKRKMSRDVQEYVAAHCQCIFATYGIFGEGSDVDTLDMGVELTPRFNVRQPIGRVLRIKPGKLTPEWYSISDTVTVYPPLARAAELFAPDRPEPYQWLVDGNKAREASFRDQLATVSDLEI